MIFCIPLQNCTARQRIGGIGFLSSMVVAGLVLAGLIAESTISAMAAGNEGTGTLSTTSGIYTFTPTSCGIYKDGDFYDIEIGGPGQAPDGEKFYFELSSTGNSMAINLGAEGPFDSVERRLLAGQHVSQPFTIDVSDNGTSGHDFSVTGLVLVDDNAQPVDENSSLKISCR